MNWISIGASMAGSSHTRVAAPCDDFHLHNQSHINGHNCFYAFAADGAGSASEARMAAEISCIMAESYFTEAIKKGQNLTELLVYQLLEQVYNDLQTEANNRQLSLNQFACTLLGCVIYKGVGLFFQIGDGAMVINGQQPGTMEVVFWPDSGEYVNSTHFLVEDYQLKNLRCKLIPAANLNQLAIFTDGLQLLCLNYAAKLPHEPFFAPMLHMLKQAGSTDKAKVLEKKLAEYLDSDIINTRTDDDKTLILATLA